MMVVPEIDYILEKYPDHILDKKTKSQKIGNTPWRWSVFQEYFLATIVKVLFLSQTILQVFILAVLACKSMFCLAYESLRVSAALERSSLFQIFFISLGQNV